ncbi:MAG: hypothetical protein KA201_09685 [Kofleriaceae bacterium]|nr:hypothetical protein [Kofleriaceae bacterium]
MLARALACLALSLALAGVAAAAPLRVVVLAGRDDDAVIARVEGQVADLSVTLTRGPAPAAAHDLARQLAAAGAIARTTDADAVVWFVADGDGWIVNVADPAAGRVLVRRIDGGAGAMDRSAALEAAALVVRTALRGLAAGGEIGVVAEPPPPPSPTPPPPPPAPPRATPPAAPRIAPLAEVGWIAALDGDAAAGHHGLAAALGVRRGRWQLAATVAHFPATARTSALATIAVDRQALGLAGARALLARPAWRLHLGLALAATRFGRATTATSGALMATADRATWSATVTPTVRIDRRLGRAAWLALDVGATALATVPAFEVRGPAGAAEVGRLWAVEPTVALSIAVSP